MVPIGKRPVGTATASLNDIVTVLLRLGLSIVEAMDEAYRQRGERPYESSIHAVKVDTGILATRELRKQPANFETPDTGAVDEFNRRINTATTAGEIRAMEEVYGDQCRPTDCESYLKKVMAAECGQALPMKRYGRDAMNAFDAQREQREREQREREQREREQREREAKEQESQLQDPSSLERLEQFFLRRD